MSSDPSLRARNAGAKILAKALLAYQTPSNQRAAFELLVTVVPFVALWVAMVVALNHGLFVIYALLVIPCAGFLVRMFLIQHDCGHGAFVRRKKVNDWIGRGLSVLTITPYDHWRYSHALHHASAGNLDARGVGDVDTLTVAEYEKRGAVGRLRYRAYRHPLVLLVIAPAYLFVVQNRWPAGHEGKGWKPWASTMGTNLAVIAIAAFVARTVGVANFALIEIPTLLLAATAGVWLFYVQHQFEHTHWCNSEDWRFHEAALQGSSHYDLPLVLRWFSANIGIHHIHHLSSRIPFYRLPVALGEIAAHDHAGRLTLMQSFSCLKLTLWDDAQRRLISFSEARTIARAR